MNYTWTAFWVRLLFIWPAIAVWLMVKWSVLAVWHLLRLSWWVHVTMPVWCARKLVAWTDRRYGQALIGNVDTAKETR